MSLPHVLSTVVCLVALAWPALSTASYLIQLRNGRQVVASRYWQEEHTIRFETDGGVASVAESAVLHIQTIEEPPASEPPPAAEQHAAPTAETICEKPIKEESLPTTVTPARVWLFSAVGLGVIAVLVAAVLVRALFGL